MFPYSNNPNAAFDPQTYQNLQYQQPQPAAPVNPLQQPAGTFNPRTGQGQQTFYQVKEGDTLTGVATQTGMTVEELSAANGGAKALPPKGSYISLPRPGFAAPPQIQSAIGPQPTTVGLNSLYAERRGDPTAKLHRSRARQIEELFDQGKAPSRIPAGVLGFMRNDKGLPMTVNDILAIGYTFNPATGDFVIATPGQTPTGFVNAPQTPQPPVPTVYYSKSRGWVTPEVARLLDKRKRRRAEEAHRAWVAAQLAAQSAVQTTHTPETVLDLHLGSG